MYRIRTILNNVTRPVLIIVIIRLWAVDLFFLLFMVSLTQDNRIMMAWIFRDGIVLNVKAFLKESSDLNIHIMVIMTELSSYPTGS